MATPPRTGRSLTKLKTSGILPLRVRVRSCKYLNNVVEQDHRRIKQRIRPILGFKRFETAAVTIRGNALAEKSKKQQFNLKSLTEKATTPPEMWAVVLAALSLENHSPDKNIHLTNFAPEPPARRPYSRS